MHIFRDRREAGRKLGEEVSHLPRLESPLVLGLPRGGVPVAYEVASVLDAPLDIFVVRKLGVPGREELAMGAIASGGVRTMSRDIIRLLGISEHEMEEVVERERLELARREELYRQGRPPMPVRETTAILVDDGLATGSSMRAAVAGVKMMEPRRVIVAVPVAPEDTCRELEAEADDVVCLETPAPFMGVSAWYRSFEQTSDPEVQELLADSHDSRERA